MATTTLLFNFCCIVLIASILSATTRSTSGTSIIMEVDAAGNISRPSPQLEGDWKLKEIWDREHSDKPRPLPSGSDDGPFIFRIGKQSGGNDGIFNLSVKIGNSMRTTVELIDKDNDDVVGSSGNKIKVGPVMGTRMLVSDELNRLENYLSSYLPQMEFLEVRGRGTSEDGLLVMTTTGDVDDTGHKPKIVCEAVEASQA